MKALTIRQPWAWLIFHGKDIENRDWYTSYRGPLAIHAAKGMTRAEYEDAADFAFDLGVKVPPREELVFSAILGTVRLANCTQATPSPWYVGRFGFVLRDARVFDVPIPAKGALSLWDWEARDGH